MTHTSHDMTNLTFLFLVYNPFGEERHHEVETIDHKSWQYTCLNPGLQQIRHSYRDEVFGNYEREGT